MPPRYLVILAAMLASSPVFAGTTPTAAPVHVDPAKVHAEVLHTLSVAHSDVGLAGYRADFAQANTAADGQAILAEMRKVIQENAKTPRYQKVGSRTVQLISDSIKDDADFHAIKDQLDKLPKMLENQLVTDEFKSTHDMKHLNPHDKQYYDGLVSNYNALMPPHPRNAPRPQGVVVDDMGMSMPAPNPAASTSGSLPPAPKHEPIMNRFHVDYAQATNENPVVTPPVTPPVAPPSGPPVTPPSGGTGASSNGGTAGGTTPNAGPPAGYPPIEHIDDMITDSPSSSANWQLRADYKLQTGDFGGAASDAERALSLGGGTAARVTLGEAELAQGDKPGAHEQAGAALETDPDNKRAQALLHFSEGYASVAAPKAPAFGGSADPGGSGPGAGGASRLSALGLGNTLPAQLSAADLHRAAANALHLGDVDGALSFINRGLSQDPNNPALLNLRATIFARRQDYDKAAADAKAGLALAPKNAALLKTLAYAQVRGKHYKDALDSSDELISLNPGDAYALALRANAHAGMGDRDAMMSDINRAAALDPRFQGMAAEMAKLVQLPADQDVLFLFPGEQPGARTPAPASGRGRSFGLLVGASALGGLLLALGLLQTVMAPLKEKLTSAFTRVTRGVPASVAAANDTAQPASVNGLVPGLIRGQYEISRQIGMGGMGMVFAGTDRSLDRPVAIKKMREELRINPQERARFVIEAKTVAALHHPNIVDIYAIAEDGEDVYLIFEFVGGKTVHELTQQSGRLPIAETARVVRAAADALGYAHEHGVIHRDVKPSNVMVDGTGRVKVMDFGIARMAKDSMTRYSMTNTVVGTPPYMAPEQEQGHVRRESDVYALAVCAYEMLTGKLPFIGIGAGMLMNKINMTYVAPSRAIAGLPAPLDEVFAKAFQADPDKRWRTPKEFADALESALPSTARV